MNKLSWTAVVVCGLVAFWAVTLSLELFPANHAVGILLFVAGLSCGWVAIDSAAELIDRTFCIDDDDVDQFDDWEYDDE